MSWRYSDSIEERNDDGYMDRQRMHEQDMEREREEAELQQREQHEREMHARHQEEMEQEAMWEAAQQEERAVLCDINNILIKRMAQLTEDEFIAWISGLYLKHGQTLFFPELTLDLILAELKTWAVTLGESSTGILARLFNPQTCDLVYFEDEDDYKAAT